MPSSRHDAAAVGGQQGLCGVEVDALVHQLDAFANKAAGLGVIAADQGDDAVAVVVLVPGVHLHRAGHQHLLAVQLEEVGTFPHDAVLAAAGVQNGDVFPVEAVGAAEQQGRAALRPALPDDDGGVAAVRLPPNLRVPEIEAAEAVGQVVLVQHRGREGLLIIEAVPHRDALGLHLAHLAVRLRLFAYAGVEQQLPAVGQLGRRPRETAILVGGAVGGEGGGQILPVQQVAADGVAPVHGAPYRLVGVILVEQVVLAFIIREAVGVVHPADVGGQVVGGAFGSGDGRAVPRLIDAGVL